jgi:nucleotide-binding universal stress UspA family protein
MGASVVLAYIVDEALAMGDVDAGIFPDQALKALKEKTENLLHNIKDELGGGVETEILTPVGEVRKMVPDLIKRTGAKLIVIETHKHSAIDRLIEGSVAESVLHCSSIPVLIIPASKKNNG